MSFASWQRYCTALQYWASAKLCGVDRGRHLYSAGRSSSWALAHISSSSLFSSPNLSRRRLDLPYFHTWCGASANLECRSEMYCTRLAGNAGCKTSPKIAIWAPSHNFVGLYLRNQGTYRQSEKKLIKQKYLLQMFSQYGELRPTSG